RIHSWIFHGLRRRRRPSHKTAKRAWSDREFEPGHGQRTAQSWPVEGRAGIVLSARRDVLVPGDRRDRIALGQTADHCTEALVLGRIEALAFEAFELDADRIVVAVAAAAPVRSAGMPGPLVARDELEQRTVATHEGMRRDPEGANRLEIWVRAPVEPIGEEPLDRVAAVFARGQADRMDDDEVDHRSGRPRSEVWRRDPHGLAQPTVL